MNTKFKTGSILGSLVLKLAIILMILLVASYLRLRLDFSKNRLYSLSKTSREAVKNLKDNMVVKLYTSQELPAQMSSIDRYVKDLLSEYQNAGKGRFHYEFVRNLSLDELRTQAQQNGLGSMFFQIYENDKTTTKEVIYGLVFEYQGNVASLNVGPRLESRLEYELTLKIQSLARQSLPEIGLYADTLYSMVPKETFNRDLNANFNVVETELLSPPKQTEVLVFPGTIDSLSNQQLYYLDQYLMKGGSLVVMQDRVFSDGSRILPLHSNIFAFFEHYGIRIDDAVAMDILCDIRQMGTETSLPFPIYPVLRGSEHPITRNISGIVMYMPTGIGAIKKDGVKYTSVLTTSPNSAILPGPDYVLSAQLFQDLDPELFRNPPITLGGIVEGRMQSYFAGKPESKQPGFVAETDRGRLVIFGDRELYIDSDKREYAERHYIVLNAVDWLLGRDSMLNIRSRHLQSSILNIQYYMEKKDIVWGDPEKIERNIKTGIKLVSVVLPSLLLIGLGAFLALRRKQLMVEKYEKK